MSFISKCSEIFRVSVTGPKGLGHFGQMRLREKIGTGKGSYTPLLIHSFTIITL